MICRNGVIYSDLLKMVGAAVVVLAIDYGTLGVCQSIWEYVKLNVGLKEKQKM